jgi:hypothetical protein
MFQVYADLAEKSKRFLTQDKRTAPFDLCATRDRISEEEITRLAVVRNLKGVFTLKHSTKGTIHA